LGCSGQQIHARIAVTLENQFPRLQSPNRNSWRRGRLPEKAVASWLRAGQRALERSATLEAAAQFDRLRAGQQAIEREAVAQLQKGLDEPASLPDEPWRQQQELALRIALRR